MLLVKINSLLRNNMVFENSEKIDAKDFILNTSNTTIKKEGKIVEFTKNQYKIFITIFF